MNKKIIFLLGLVAFNQIYAQEGESTNQTPEQKFLESVKNAPLQEFPFEAMTPEQEKQLIQNLSDVAKARAEKGEPLSSKNWWVPKIEPVIPPGGNGDTGVPG